jgi:hypothetical protein
MPLQRVAALSECHMCIVFPTKVRHFHTIFSTSFLAANVKKWLRRPKVRHDFDMVDLPSDYRTLVVRRLLLENW